MSFRKEAGGIFYDSELHFLRDVFRKSRIQTAIVTPGDPIRNIVPPGFEVLFENLYPADAPLHNYLKNVAHGTMYRTTDSTLLSYIYFVLPESPKSEYLFIGPYARSPFSPQALMELGENLGISPKNQSYFEEYYNSIPVLSENSHIFIMLNSFCELIWRSPSFAVVDSDSDWQFPGSPINKTSTEGFDDVMMNMVALERRYSYENNLIKSVELGQMQNDTMLPASMIDSVIERRTADPLRNLKNYSIIMNTLLRKAAERGGVHPMYIDRVSSSFAIKIEQLSSSEGVVALMSDMHRTYCRLVRKYALNNYSPVVQKAIILIDSDLSANLTLSTLAGNQGISPGYLSTIFKKETGKTVSEYIRDKRVAHAAHLLTTTHLQIQTVALHCGIMDVQYFSKIFKKQTGKTPKEYRESAKQS